MSNRFFSARWWIGLLAALVLPSLLFGASSAWAEGSRSLYPANYLTLNPTGSRANLDVSAPGSRYVNRVKRSAFLYVYAEVGEYILLGSRNRSNSGDIRVYNPQSFGVPGDETVPATADFTCSGGSTQPGTHYSGGTLGTISSRAQELAGPNSADNTATVTNGFAPCAYQAPVTGIYGVVFTAATSGTGPNGSVDTPAVSNNSVSAWDVTVRADRTSVTDINGRLFTYAFIGFTGGNSLPLYSTHYHITSDGYRYRQDLRGLDPNGYALYANSLGFLDNGQPLYKDLRGNEPLVTSVPPGVATQIAEYPTFFSDVSPSGLNNAEINRVLDALSIPRAPTPPTVSDVSFTGNVTGSTSTVGAGGTFRFNTTETITFQIIVSRDGVNSDPNNPLNRVLTGIARTGSHTVVWDGKDGNGANFPPGIYLFRITGRNGEVHFPIIDAENNPGGGPTITRLNGPNTPDTTVFFDDRGYITSSGTRVGVLNGTLCPTAVPAAPNPPVALQGMDSSTAYRAWQSGLNRNTDCRSDAGWGDAKGLNLWAYFSTTPEGNELLIVPITVDVATTVTAPAIATAGSTVQGTFSFSNNGTSPAAGVTYGLQLAPGLTNVTIGNLPPGVGFSYNPATGQVTFTGLPATLDAGQSISGLTFSYTAPASGSVMATTTIDTTSPDTFPDNNTASATTRIGATDVFTQVSVPASGTPGQPVAGTFTFGNAGNTAAAGITYAATIGSPGNFPTSVNFTNLPTGVTANYDLSNGQVTFTGLPTTLAPTQSFNFGFTYTGPASGSVPVNTSITTTSADANPANNTASGVTNFAQADLAVTKTNNVTTVTTGGTTTYTVVVTNNGPATANGAVITDPSATGLTKTAVSCAPGPNAVCPASPTVGQLESGLVIPTLPANSSVTFAITANVTASTGLAVTNVARVAPPNGVTDSNTSNDSARDTDTVTAPPTGSTVSGTVFNDLNGNGVQDPGESGIGGVTVTLTPTAGGPALTVQTDVSGSYQFTGVPPGSYTVTETDPSGYGSTSSNVVPVSVPAGGGATANFGDQQQGTVSGTVFNDLNGNGVQDPGEGGIGGVTVTLTPTGGGAARTATTAGDGSYLFGGVTSGSYTVTETDPSGYGSTSSNVVPVSVPAGGGATANFGDQQQGTVSGTVFNDLNGNGVQDPGEGGIGGVTVTLTPTGGGAARTATTAGDGSYLFGGVTSGSYTVTETDPSGYGSTSSNVVPVSVPAGGGATANFGDQQQGTVSGTVFNDLNGNGVQDPGEGGIGGVTVTLTPTGGGAARTATTAGDGSYLFGGVTSGSYTVTETDPSGYGSTSSNVVPVSVPAGGGATANFGDQQQGTVSGTVFNDLNGNGVQDPGEGGIGGVTVTLTPTGGGAARTATTAGDGSYLFGGVTSGSYTVTETDPSGYGSTSSNVVPVSVPAGGGATANFGDQQQGTVSGTVFNDLNGNGVQDPGEGGIGGVTVTLTPTGGGAARTATTAGDGSYLFGGVTSGSYTVTETDPSGYGSTSSNVVPVSVPAGGGATANFGDQQQGTVSGTVFNDLNGNGVQDPGEGGIGGVTVTLTPTGGGAARTATTAGDGSYLFGGVTSGSYTVTETDPSGYGSTSSNVVPVSVPAGGGATANFGDQQQGTVSGTVFNDLNGNGVQDPGEPGLGGVTVQLLNSNGNVIATTTTTGGGNYSFTNLTPGTYTVQETDPVGFVSTTPNTRTATVPPGGTATPQFGDQQQGTVNGTVFDDLNGNGVQDPGEPGLGGVTVELLDANGNVVATTTTVGNGNYSFAGVTPGSYSVRETDPAGFASTTPNTASVSVPPGGSASAQFGDQQQGTVNGTVFSDLNGNGVQDPGESGLGGVVVELLDANGNVIVTTTTTGDGSYSFAGVVPGNYSVRINNPSDYVNTTPNVVRVNVVQGGAASAQFGVRQQPGGQQLGADLSLSKTLATAGLYVVGQSLTYTLVVRNAGPSTATNVQITDT